MHPAISATSPNVSDSLPSLSHFKVVSANGCSISSRIFSSSGMLYAASLSCRTFSASWFSTYSVRLSWISLVEASEAALGLRVRSSVICSTAVISDVSLRSSGVIWSKKTKW